MGWTSTTDRHVKRHRPTTPRSFGMRQRRRSRSKIVRFLFWRALVGLLFFDVLLFDRSFLRLHKRVQSWKVRQQSPKIDAVERICHAVNHACMWYPKRVLCLQRSAVMTCLLRSCGIGAEMVIGAQKLPFKAHAWTEVNGCAINERRDVRAIYGVWERC